MPQSPIQQYVANNPSGVASPLATDTFGALVVDNAPSLSRLNITASTLVKAGVGEVVVAIVNTAGSTAGAIHDAATTGGVSAATLIATLPNTVGSYTIRFPYALGLVVVPGTGQVVSVSYN